MRWISVVFAVLINVAVLAWVAAPMLVTYAEIPPREVTCEACASPEVQRALAHAASIGRAQILSQVTRVYPALVGLSIVNLAFLIVFISGRQRSAA
jgi:hypothetical protein